MLSVGMCSKFEYFPKDYTQKFLRGLSNIQNKTRDLVLFYPSSGVELKILTHLGLNIQRLSAKDLFYARK